MSAKERFAIVLNKLADKFTVLDRYERRVLSKRKAAIRAFDTALGVPPPAL